jgi:hypothetical protein
VSSACTDVCGDPVLSLSSEQKGASEPIRAVAKDAGRACNAATTNTMQCRGIAGRTVHACRLTTTRRFPSPGLERSVEPGASASPVKTTTIAGL